jgi:hypothetical protein
MLCVDTALFGGRSLLMFLSPATSPAPPATQEESPSLSSEPVYRQTPPSLTVRLSDGRTVLLRPECVVESALESADRELIAILFQRGRSIELLHRAIWIGSALQEMDHWRDCRPALPLIELAALLDLAARTTRVGNTCFDVPHRTLWRRFLSRVQ